MESPKDLSDHQLYHQLGKFFLESCYYLIDSTHHMMPIALSTDQFISLWMMVSNQPFYAGLEWNGLELQLISLWQGAHYQCL